MGPQIVDPNLAINFAFAGALAGGMSVIFRNIVHVQYAGNYKFTYLVSTSNAGAIAITANGSVLDSTIWATGVTGLTVNGIGIITVPANTNLSLVNYENSNAMTLQDFVNAAWLLEKIG